MVAWCREVEAEVQKVGGGGNGASFMETKMQIISSGVVRCTCPGWRDAVRFLAVF